MIGKIKGKIDYIDLDEHCLIVDVMGVGYVAFVTTNILSSCKIGDDIILWIEMIVKEEQLSLYGFLDLKEKQWFNLLQTVQGVGAKMSLSILSALPIERIAAAIIAQDAAAFKTISGIGLKIASRIVNELKNKQMINEAAVVSHKEADNDNLKDAASALVNFGFNRAEIYKVLSELIANNNQITLEALIKEGLSKLSVSN